RIATNTATSTPIPARISRGLSRKGRRAGGVDRPCPVVRLGVMDVTVAGMIRNRLGNEREFRAAERRPAIPRPEEPGIARLGARADADVILAVGFERRGRRQGDPFEARHPAPHGVLILGWPRVFDAA